MNMHWLEKAFNFLFLGPSGIGKSYLAIGLGGQAVELGYQVCFVMMGELIRLLNTEAISVKSKRRLKQIMSADLVIIDEVGLMPVTLQEANMFVHIISNFYQH